MSVLEKKIVSIYSEMLKHDFSQGIMANTVEFRYNNAFSSVPTKFLPSTCIRVQSYRDFACSDTSSWSTQNILFVYTNSCKFSLQFEV